MRGVHFVRRIFIGWPLLFVAAAVRAQVAIPVDSARAVAVGHRIDLYWIIGSALALSIPAVVLLSGWGARLRSVCQRLMRGSRYGTLTLFGAAYVLLNAILSLPFDYFRDYRLPSALGWLGRESAGQWLLGQVLLLLPVLAAIGLFLWMLYALLRRSPRFWWLWATLTLAPVALGALVIQPVWLKPLTAHYVSLPAGPRRAMIEDLAARCGIPHPTVVVGGSDTAVYGLGPTTRIFLQSDFDKAYTPAQLRFTVAHELKHYIEGDNWKAWLTILALMLGGFGLVEGVARWALPCWHRHLGFERLDDPASLPLFVLCLTALWIAVTPAFLVLNRHIEREADRFGLELSHENEAAARMFAGWVGDGEMAHPGWFERVFIYKHPPLAERIEMANDYHPWLTGAPLVYADDCAMDAPVSGRPASRR